jgi:hypothetical protein
LLFAITQSLFEKPQIRNHIKCTTRTTIKQEKGRLRSEKEAKENTSGNLPIAGRMREKTQLQYITIGLADARKKAACPSRYVRGGTRRGGKRHPSYCGKVRKKMN